MASENVDLIRLGFELFQRGGLESLLPYVDPEVEVYATATVLNAGTFHGHDGFLSWAREWLDAWSEVAYEPIDFIEVGSSVVVVPVNQRASGASSGIEVEQEITWLFETREGKITRFHLYDEREKALEVAREITGSG